MCLRIIPFVALLGLAACEQGNGSDTIPEPADSVLKPDDHKHNWLVISSEGNTVVLADSSYKEVFETEQASYPKALIRVYAGYSTSSSYFADSIAAVDCNSSQMAPFVAFYADDETGEGERVTYPREFRSTAEMNPNTRSAIFGHVCGPEWSYEAPR